MPLFRGVLQRVLPGKNAILENESGYQSTTFLIVSKFIYTSRNLLPVYLLLLARALFCIKRELGNRLGEEGRVGVATS